MQKTAALSADEITWRVIYEPRNMLRELLSQEHAKKKRSGGSVGTENFARTNSE